MTDWVELNDTKKIKVDKAAQISYKYANEART